MRKSMKRNWKKVVAAMLAAVSVVSGAGVAGTSEVKAATYTQDNQSLSINNGMAVLTVGGTETYQLTKSLVVKDGGFDNQKTVYLLWLSGTVFCYNYQLQGNDTTLIKVDTGVTSLTFENNVVTGYETAAGHKSTLTIEQIKEKLNPSSGNQSSESQSSGSQSSGSQSSGSQSSGNQNGESQSSGSQSSGSQSSGSQNGESQSSGSQSSGSQNGGSQTDGSTLNKAVVTSGVLVTYNDGSKNYILSTSKKVDKVITDSRKNVWIRYNDGSIYVWNYDTQKNATVVLYLVTDSSFSMTENGYYTAGGFVSFPEFSVIVANNNKDVIVSNNAIKFKVAGLTYSLNVAVAVGEAYLDNDNNLWVRYTNNDLYSWCYEVQKNEANVKLYKVASNVTKLVAIDDRAVGYYVQGSTSIVPLQTTTQLKSLIEKANATTTTETEKQTTTTKTTTTKTTYAYSVISKGSYKILQNSAGKDVDKFKLKSGIFKYHGITLKTIQKAEFTRNGNVILITKKGKLFVINYKTLKRKTIKTSGISRFSYSKRGLAIYAVRKTGTRFSITKY